MKAYRICQNLRIRVTDILEMLAENVSVTEILEDFPKLYLLRCFCGS
ncbi:DUF433 domain-containing protein [Nostocales cyanobacterium LEGE 11386]|nr:DUF433 domain-containing protein [Nostocales cyanobacterium LEGE 11386]